MATIKPYDVAKPFRRTNDFPLDVTSVFASVEEANSYLSGETSYLGQVLAIVTNQSDVEIYKVGYDSVTSKKVLLPIGGSSEAVTTSSITINAGGQQYLIPIGSDLTEALGQVKNAIEAVDSMDGKITEDIIISGTTYARSGSTVTNVLGDLYGMVVSNAMLTSDILSGTTVYLRRGDNLQVVTEKLFNEIKNKADGKITEDILNGDGDVIIQSGTTVTNAFKTLIQITNDLNDRVKALEESESPIKSLIAGDDITITEDTETGTYTIDVKGVSNDKVTLDEEKTVTLTFDVNGGESAELEGMVLTGSTYGDSLNITIPVIFPVRTDYSFRGYWIDMNMDGTQVEGEIFQPGDSVQFQNLSSISPYVGTIVAIWKIVDEPDLG